MQTFLYRLYQLFIFFPLFIVVTILVALITTLGCMVGLSRWFAFGPSRFWGWFTIRALFLPVKVEGREHLQRTELHLRSQPPRCIRHLPPFGLPRTRI